FLDPSFASYAKSVPVKLKVGIHDNRTFGKFILRTCFADKLGEIVWREKMAQEVGAGAHRIEGLIHQLWVDGKYHDNLGNAANEGVSLRSKEHAFYFALYRKYYPKPSEEECSLRCPSCNGCFKYHGRFCRKCGAFPVDPVRSL